MAAIKADVIVHMLDEKSTLFQLRYVEVGFSNEDGPVNITYNSVFKNLVLEEPFIAHLSAEEVSKRP